MQVFRGKESDKFISFLNLVQAEAAKHDAVFFVENGEGEIFENDEMECEDLFGWFII